MRSYSSASDLTQADSGPLARCILDGESVLGVGGQSGKF